MKSNECAASLECDKTPSKDSNNSKNSSSTKNLEFNERTTSLQYNKSSTKVSNNSKISICNPKSKLNRHQSGNYCCVFGGCFIKFFNEGVLFIKSGLLMLMLLPAFDQKFRVGGDGLCVNRVLPLECGWIKGDHGEFTKFRHRDGDTVHGGV